MHVECHAYQRGGWTVYVWTGNKLLGEVYGSRVDFDTERTARAYARELRKRIAR